ncbi:MAG: ABC transporter ATP-binding protein [Rhodoferax sp.]|nr:ABC transporter ATP-binding protein [Rhodoferax sp.]MCF8210046.1 ABC transporter ATP-binding protein [Rhodoferax sp.]
MSYLIDVHDKTYDNGCHAIAELRFAAVEGEFIAIVGPSGAGKSTLLNLVAGLDTRFAGQVSARGQSLSRANCKIGFLFQESRLMPWLTVEGNLRLVLSPAQRKSTDLAHWLAQVGLQGFGAAFPGQLSGGMQRRVALLRAFLVQPDLLLMDEPFHSLDAPTAAQLRSLLFTLWPHRRPTVLFVTHNLREALGMAHRVLFLSARPARILLDYAVPHSTPRGLDDAPVSAAHEHLLREHPHLLEGLQASDSSNG